MRHISTGTYGAKPARLLFNLTKVKLGANFNRLA
jgi:hypothetical protein